MELPVNYEKLHWTKRREVREEYVRRQDGKCCHCESRLSCQPAVEVLEKPLNMKLFPDKFLKWPVHLHHDHKTGMTIGAVHAWCNGVLWQYHGE